MTGTELWKSIAAIAFSGAGLIAVFAFIARSMFEHYLSARLESHKDTLAHALETHKAKLAADNALALEKFKAELQAAAFEHQTQFSYLHQERGKVIAELYRLLSNVESAIRVIDINMQANLSPRGDALADASQARDSFSQYFDVNRIYFDESLCSIIEQLSWHHLEAWLTSASTHLREVTQEDRDSFSQVLFKISETRKEIEKRVRQMLGVPE